MWSLRAWRRQRILARHPVSSEQWQAVLQQLPMLDGLNDAEQQRLRERAVLFLHHKHLSALPGVELDGHARLLFAGPAELPLLPHHHPH